MLYLRLGGFGPNRLPCITYNWFFYVSTTAESASSTTCPIKLVVVIPNVMLFCSSVRTHALFSGKKDVNGVCGSSCEGIEGVDTIGVYEFDTKTGTVVATHLLAEGIGADPYTSPNGSK